MASGGVDARLMPKPVKGETKKNQTPLHPYEHLKMIITMTPDGPVGYVGSINFSYQSAHEVDKPLPGKKSSAAQLVIYFVTTYRFDCSEYAGGNATAD